MRKSNQARLISRAVTRGMGMNKRKAAGLIALILLCLFCLSACQESTEAKYDRAQRLLTEEKYFEATSVFDEISTYADSSKMSMYAKAIAVAENGQYESAISSFRSLGDFKDSSLMITYYTGRQYESQASTTDWSPYITAAEYYDMVGYFLDSRTRAEACRKTVYDEAIRLAGNGEFGQAIEMLGTIPQYSDSADLSKYYAAFKLEQEEKFSEAAAAFAELGTYRNSAEQAERVLQRGYDKADVLDKAGNLEEASKIFASLGDYEDAAERASKPYYDLGVAKREEKDWYAAIQAFEKAGDYSDAQTQILETRYQQAEYRREQQNWSEAISLFTELGDYKDSSLQVNETYYQQASALEENGEQDSAYDLFISLGTYKDAYERANKPYYDLGIAKRDAREWDAAVAAFAKIGQYEDAAEQINETYFQQASALETAGDQESAYELFMKLGEYKDSFERANKPYYDLGVAKREAEEWEEAAAAFAHAGTYSDAAEQIGATYYAEGLAKRAAQDWDGARAAFANAADYADASEQIAGTWYAEGQAKRAAQDWEGARTAFGNAGDYADAINQIAGTWYTEGESRRISQDWEEARAAFKNAGEYSDAAIQILATWYMEGVVRRDAQDWDGARTAFENAGEYNHAEREISETTYREAAALEIVDPEAAIRIYTALGEYANSLQKVQELWYQIGLIRQEAKEWDEAVAAFMQAGDYSDAKDQIAATRILEGKAKETEQDWDGAIEAYKASGNTEQAQMSIEACLYQKAVSLCEQSAAGEVLAERAIEALQAISDTELFIKARDLFIQKNTFYDAWAAQFKTGNTIEFGKYEQDNDPANGPEPISWRVIYAQDGEALLLSEKVIDAMPFMADRRRSELNNLSADEIWQQSQIFQWLRDDFILSFSEQETSLFTASENQEVFFVLDNKEYKQYCASEESQGVQATAYALSKDAEHGNLRYYYKDADGNRVPGTSVMWWIRTGAIKEEGYLYPDNLGMVAGVRPATRISLENGPTGEWIDRQYPVRKRD